MDACTVTAPDAITTFAVPNPNRASQLLSVFSGPAVLRVAPPSGSPGLLWTGDCLFSPTLSTVDARNTNTEPITVNAHYWCNRPLRQAAVSVSVRQDFLIAFHTCAGFDPLSMHCDRIIALAFAAKWMYSEASEVCMQERLASLVADMHRGGILYREAVRAFKKAYISAALRENKGNLSRTAPSLGLHRNTLTRICGELELDLGSFRAGARRPPKSAAAFTVKRAAR